MGTPSQSPLNPSKPRTEEPSPSSHPPKILIIFFAGVRLAGPHLLLPLRPRDGERPGAGEDAQPFPEGPRRGPHPIPPAGSYWEDTAGWGTQASRGDPGGQEGAEDGGAQPWPGRGSERSDGVGSTFSVGEVLELPSRRICSRISKSTADSLCPGDPRGAGHGMETQNEKSPQQERPDRTSSASIFAVVATKGSCKSLEERRTTKGMGGPGSLVRDLPVFFIPGSLCLAQQSQADVGFSGNQGENSLAKETSGPTHGQALVGVSFTEACFGSTNQI
ncbi:uncharacterized protein LOC142360161 [Opisthocomus hoazin]|uniref:uncharacterized protein LOC142360161 n=1 Tax=Opisthocomus hoazin TaxID=30419 RepID=UPI003F52A43D